MSNDDRTDDDVAGVGPDEMRARGGGADAAGAGGGATSNANPGFHPLVCAARNGLTSGVGS